MFSSSPALLWMDIYVFSVLSFCNVLVDLGKKIDHSSGLGSLKSLTKIIV